MVVTTVFRILNSVVTALVLLILLVAVLPYVNLPIKVRLYAVASQSMTPTLVKGDLIVSQQEQVYKEGDIITFTNPLGGKRTDTVTHRVVAMEDKEGTLVYKTKGDANNAADSWELKADTVLGKYQWKIPLVGTVITFSKTPLGLVALIILPGTMIAYSELMNIKREVVKLFSKKPKHEETAS